MKKLLLSFALIGAITGLTTEYSLGEQCTTNDSNCNNFMTVLAENTQVSSCIKNAGVIRVTVTNKTEFETLVSITVTGPNNYNKTVPLFPLAGNETKDDIEFTGLINGSYTIAVTSPVFGCTFTCLIVVNNRKRNCLPLLCCSK